MALGTVLFGFAAAFIRLYILRLLGRELSHFLSDEAGRVTGICLRFAAGKQVSEMRSSLSPVEPVATS